MSVRERSTYSTGISVYLTPRAKTILEQYVQNSGYGSLSRTVEEMILSYNQCHTIILSTLAQRKIEEFFRNPASVQALLLLLMNNFNLNNGSLLEKIAQQRIVELYEEELYEDDEEESYEDDEEEY